MHVEVMDLHEIENNGKKGLFEVQVWVGGPDEFGFGVMLEVSCEIVDHQTTKIALVDGPDEIFEELAEQDDPVFDDMVEGVKAQRDFLRGRN